MEDKHVNELKGANMDIDLVSDNVDWNQCTCPWNEAENTKEHKSGIKRSKSLAIARLLSLQNKSVCLIADA